MIPYCNNCRKRAHEGWCTPDKKTIRSYTKYNTKRRHNFRCIFSKVSIASQKAVSNKLALDIASVPLYYKHTTGTTPLLAPPAVPLRCCRASIAASESAISEGRFQTNLRWTSLGCHCTTIILMVLLRYLPFHYGRTKGI